MSGPFKSDPAMAVEAPLEVTPLKATACALLDNKGRAPLETGAVAEVARPMREALRIAELKGFLVRASNGHFIRIGD